MNESDPSVLGWSRLISVLLIVLLILMTTVLVYAYLLNLLWAAVVALLYLLFHPFVFLLDLKIMRYKVVVTKILQLLILLPILYIFVSLASQFLSATPELYITALIVFALTLMFAGGALYLVLDRGVRPRLTQKVEE